ncbi:MAG: coenzyme F420-0:L-glutamate ligase [Anaerolineae bacterium]|nr:coenzyme F420-0:L-glutamate ligase [Anaerolineae bacterium]
MADQTTLVFQALSGIPLVQPGDDLAAFILDGLEQAGLALNVHDILIVSSKVISKAEGRWVDLRTVVPSSEAMKLALATEKDPRLVELILRESVAVSRHRKGVLIVRHRLGFTSANAGIDHSNVGIEGDDWVLLLPEDPDASARRLRAELAARNGVAPGIVISDTHGRPFRLGNAGVAIGLAGVPGLLDLRGHADLFGRELRATIVAVADAIAAAAGLLSGEADEGRPVVLLRGLALPEADDSATELNRQAEFDLYR